MSSQERITVHNLADLKNTSDDAIPNYLNSLKFTQSHNLIDVRLALGYSALALAAACFAWDYKFGFDNTKVYTAVAVAIYTVINSALTLWTWLVEKGVVYEGTSPSGDKISIASSTDKNVPTYKLTITLTPKSSSTPQKIELARPFAHWFDSEGHFVVVPFQQMLASSVPAIGKLDTRRVVAEEAQTTGDDYAPEVLDALLAASGSASATGSSAGTEAVAKKANKRRK